MKRMSLSRSARQILEGYLLISPSLIVIFAIVIFPLGYLVVSSIYGWSFGRMAEFVGLKNYIDVFQDPDFLIVFKNTLIFSLVSSSIELLLGLGIASLLDKSGKFEGTLRIIVVMPFMVSMVAGSVSFKWILNAEFGIVNYSLIKLGLIRSLVNWLGSPMLGMLACITVITWHTTPFVALILLAGLKSIPRDLYEVSELDGAGMYQKFLFITLPLLKPAIFVSLLIRTMYSLRNFPIPYVLTGGGPGNSTKLMAMLLQEKKIQLLFGYNSALSIIMVIVTLIIVWIYVKGLRVELVREGKT
ncbi:sugar ABC transporter permease [Candidatus Aerophobetes bacterium]|nr:sugar ABC transporter permease [Candidatus Aerophobetes bacterium]